MVESGKNKRAPREGTRPPFHSKLWHESCRASGSEGIVSSKLALDLMLPA